MADGSTVSGRKDNDDSGSNQEYDLNQLVQLIERLPRPPEPKKSVNDDFNKTKGDSLLAGRKLVAPSGSVTPTDSSTSEQTDPVSSVSRIRTASKAQPDYKRLLMKAGGFLLGMGVLAVVALLVIKSSDYTDVENFEGDFANDVHLSVSPGESIPAFDGILLVDSADSWGDTFSNEDLIGKNTVIFVWGSWNEELLSWSQDLNYTRLVDLENANVQFLGLNIDQTKMDVLDKLGDDLRTWPHIFNYDNQVEEHKRLMQVLGIQSSPLILLVDSTGRLRGHGLSPDELVEAYRKLFE